MEQDIDDELQFHLDALMEQNRARGMNPETARSAALRELGGIARTRESYREAMTFVLLESFIDDVRYGMRALRKSPAFTLTAIAVLGLGIGLNAGVLSIIRALCYHPLPLPGAERLAGITRGHRLLSYALFEELREQGKPVIDVAAYDPYVSVQVGSTPKAQGGMARASLVSDNYFAVLNARTQAGSAFGVGIDNVGPTAVLSDRLAARYFGKEVNPVGAAIRINQRVFTVVGVMPPEFHGSDLMLPELWVRLRDEAFLRPGHDIRKNPEVRRLILIGRLEPEVSRMRAQAVLSSVAARTPERGSDSEHVMPLLLSPAVLFPLSSEMRPYLLLLMAPTGLVLLIACANLANLLLARASSRGKEIATRLALGAGRARLVRQLVTESILLALLGGTAGTLLAMQLLQHASGYLGEQAANMGVVLPPFTLDAQAWGCTLAISLFAAVACGLTPALNASRQELASAARQDSAGARGSRLRGVLMTAQIAVCTLLLSAAGLMIRSFQESLTTDPGFRTERLIAVEYPPENAGYTPSRMAAFRQRLQARLQSLTRVRAFAEAAAPPLSDRPTIALLALDGGANTRSVNSPFNRVSRNYFELLGIPIADGRTFTAVEIAAGLPVALVSQATALRLWPGESAIGKRFRVLEEGAPVREVVGVVGDTRSVWLSRVDENYVYLPFDPNTTERSTILAEVESDTAEALSGLSKAIQSVDAELPVSIHPLRELVNNWRLLPLAGSALAISLAAVALALAGVGMYGVTSYVAGQQTREFGIRMALGATRGAILSMVFRQGLRVVGVGLAIGWTGAVALGRLLMGSFYGLRPYDPASLAFVLVFLGVTALAAMYGPANRAAKVDPVASLRQS